MENQLDNKFTWVIKDFFSQRSKRIYSDEFLVDGCKWRLLAYPKGNGVKQQLSLYLAVADSKALPIGWRRNTYFRITIVNQPLEEELSHTRDTQHWFDASTCDWGFTSMFSLIDLDEGEYLVNGELKIVAEIYVLEVIGDSNVPEDSEEKTKALRKIEENDTEESNDLHKEASAVKECMDVNGFRVLPSQVETVHCIFERHPSMALEFPKNQHLRSSYMNVLLSVIDTMRQSSQEISKDDLADANDALAYLTAVGLNLKWLEEKLEKVTEKKEMNEAVETRMQGIEEELKELKLKCSNLEAQLEKERAIVSTAKAPLTLDDVV